MPITPSPPAAPGLSASPRARLGLRAAGLLKLERLFPPLVAPSSDDEAAAYECRKAAGSYAKFVEELGGVHDKRVLDLGCGWGGETLWLARYAASAVGCDIHPGRIAAANRLQAQSQQPNLAFALIQDNRIPFPSNSFDAVFSTNVFEHVMQPVETLNEIKRVLVPNGSFVTTFGPLFYSPRGYHLSWATQVPYAHLLFGFQAIMAVRNLKRTAYHPADWEQTGLNRITFARFRRAVRRVGFGVRRLKRIPVKRLHGLAHLPWVGNLFTFGVDCHLVKA